jgi:hypothetical protein
MTPEIEAIKHIGNWVDGKLVCVPDCPSTSHKTDTMTFTQNQQEKAKETLLTTWERTVAPNQDDCFKALDTLTASIIQSTLEEVRRVVEGMKLSEPIHSEIAKRKNELLTDIINSLEKIK